MGKTDLVRYECDLCHREQELPPNAGRPARWVSLTTLISELWVCKPCVEAIIGEVEAGSGG